MKRKTREKFWIYYNSFGFGEGFRVEEFGRHVNEPDYQYRETRPNNIFQIVTEGVCYLTVFKGDKKTEYTLSAGDGFIVKSDIEHIYLSDENAPCTRVWMAFTGTESNEMLKNFEFVDGCCVFRGIDVKETERLFDKLRKNASSAIVSKFNVLGIVYRFFGAMANTINLSKTENAEVLETDKQKDFVNMVVQYIDSHIKEDISVESLASLFGYERSYFYKVFKKYTGVSVQKYVVNRRIAVARRLCTETQMPFSNIARELGYDNYVSFYKAFVKIVHNSPETYRKMYSKDND